MFLISNYKTSLIDSKDEICRDWKEGRNNNHHSFQNRSKTIHVRRDNDSGDMLKVMISV